MTTDEAMAQEGGCSSGRCEIDAPKCNFSETRDCGGYVNLAGLAVYCGTCPSDIRTRLENEASAKRNRFEAERIAAGHSIPPGSFASDFVKVEKVEPELAAVQAAMVAGLESKQPTPRELELEGALALLREETKHFKMYAYFFKAYGECSFAMHRAIDWHLSRAPEAKAEWAELHQLWSRSDFQEKSDAEADSENPATEIYAASF